MTTSAPATASAPVATDTRSRTVLHLLIAIQLISMSGHGVFFAVSAVYFTQVVGLSVHGLGLALTVAGGVGVVATYVAGLAADRWSARTLIVAALLVQGVTLAALPWSRDLVVFGVLAGVESAAGRGSWTARQTLLARAFTGADRTPARAKMRVASNLGIGLGSAAAALVLADGRGGTFRCSMTGAAVLFFVAAVGASRIPRDRPPQRGSAADTATTDTAPVHDVVPPWRNRRYVATAAVNGAVVTHFAVVEVGVPIWLITRTDAPAVLVSVLLLINTGVIVATQVPLNRGFEQPLRAARGFAIGGGLLAAACGAYAGASYVAAVPAAAVLIVGGVVHAVGEVLTSGAGFSLGYELADEHAAGQYQGFFGAAQSVGMMLGPVLVTTMISVGSLGWVVLALVYAGLGLAGYVAGAGA